MSVDRGDGVAVDTQTVRQELQTELARLETQLERQHAEADTVPGRGEQSTEQASQTLEQERSLALTQNLRTMIEQVQAALRRLENGTYGVCEGCGQAISPERLQALPFATQCVRCKEKHRNRY